MEPTLEAVVARLETLERKVAQLTKPTVRPGTANWDAVEKAMRELEDYDFDAWREQREYDLRHATDHLK
ncbi:MAG: hypothetical protein C0467_31755 [Planctomycetaceae bacterium]|nr:hypothetical protein [Planctomycetaceae bacterium]